MTYGEKYARLEAPLKVIAEVHPEYGYRRATTELRETHGHHVNRKVVERLHSLWDLPLRRARLPGPSAIRRAIGDCHYQFCSTIFWVRQPNPYRELDRYHKPRRQLLEDRREKDAPNNPGRVRVSWFPTYRELRHVLPVWAGRSQKRVTGFHGALAQLRGTPQNPENWQDPDTWIPKKLSGHDRELAHAIWTETGKTVNPQRIRGHWDLSQRYELLVSDAEDNLELTDRGRNFVDHAFGRTETFLDEMEGLFEILNIVANVGSARSADLVKPWTEFLKRHLETRSPSMTKDTLQRRLKNLLDRDLVEREGSIYAITNAGLEYMKKAGMTEGTHDIPADIKRYADDEKGRRILGVLADSIVIANSSHRECWATSIPKTRDLRFYVGFSTVMLLRSSDQVEITLLPKLLTEELRNRLRPAPHGRDYKFGGRRYLLNWKDFVDQWPSMKHAHHHAIKQTVQKTNRGPEHSTEAIGFINSVLGRELPQPGYVDHDDDTGSSASERPEVAVGGFGRLMQSLREEDLLFSEELVANYILALQTRRFAILTGISGTGKTKIARAVAQHYRPQQTVAEVPDDAVRVTVKLTHIKHSQLTLPPAIRAQVNLGTSKTSGPGPVIRVEYPSGNTKLRTYLQDGKYPELFLKGHFKEWFQATFKVGDQFWLRVHSSETDEPGALEIGLSETDVVEQPVNNYVIVPVRPDWVDNRGLLGYFNPLTNEYSTTQFLNLLLRAHDEEKKAEAAGEKPHPFFIILDEMNLARVEHYFSDFLSALESEEEIPLHENEDVESGKSQSGPGIPRKLKIPDNVFFTGTVNVDETTYMFSPKVLDRAFTIEFDQVDLEGFTKGESSEREDTAGLALDADNSVLDLLPSGSSENNGWKPSRADWVKFSRDASGHHKSLLQLHRILEAQHRHFGYRVANEIARFVNLAREQAADTNTAADAAVDLALLQKVLPKFHGTQQELESLLEEIFHFAVQGGSHPLKQKRTVEASDWRVVAGRLTAKSQPKATPVEPSSEADASGSGDTNIPDASTPSPAYPRTGAKVLRMLQRLRDRGFTSFIE